ncbi:hypothetical protein SAMN04488128_103764 [Chitinophaga eiseniae]|uniref:Uncharacterized protein n=1 Tax=Chitinophaga eiseniae TaxID=634771 RepID=A0A1T4SXW3_9BACT|nr:hypothetical protein [Chitinophaga eiseniae]SKA33084.1 hypothetical protein SAMN04488128_103764 [Chitinophaga eiseniae]
MKQPSRELPTIELSGAKFFVDAYGQQLIDTQKKDNVISIWNMLFVEDHFELLYDKAIRNVKASNWTEAKGERYEYIWLRPLGFYDNQGAIMGLQEAGRSLPTDSLPRVELAGIPFHWHEQNGELWQVDNPWNRIGKGDYTVHEKDWGIYFDTDRKVVPYPHELPVIKPCEPLPPHLHFFTWVEVSNKIQQAKTISVPDPSRKSGPKLK